MIIQVDKEKLLREFEEKYVVNRWTSEFNEIIKEYESNIESIEEDIISKFNLVCKEATALQEKQLKGKIRYIYIFLLRTSILENKGQWRIDLYDKNWFLDKEECSINIDLNFIYDSLFNHMEELSEKKKEYGRNITDMDIENIKLKEANKYHMLSFEFLRNLIEKFVKISSYENMKKTEDIKILAGEYMDEVKVIYSTQ